MLSTNQHVPTVREFTPRPHSSLGDQQINMSQQLESFAVSDCQEGHREQRISCYGTRWVGRISVNKRSSHHRVVSGQLHEAQTSTPRPGRSMGKLRKSFLTQPNQHVPTVAVNVGPVNISTVAPQTSQHSTNVPTVRGINPSTSNINSCRLPYQLFRRSLCTPSCLCLAGPFSARFYTQNGSAWGR